MSASKLSSCEAIRPLLSSLVDGEASESEIALADSHVGECTPCASYLAFLRLTDTVLSDTPEVLPPASLSERIALATYARPSFSDRVRMWFAPAPIRFGVVGTALATGIVALVVSRQPLPVTPVATNTAKGTTTPAGPANREPKTDTNDTIVRVPKVEKPASPVTPPSTVGSGPLVASERTSIPSLVKSEAVSPKVSSPTSTDSKLVSVKPDNQSLPTTVPTKPPLPAKRVEPAQPKVMLAQAKPTRTTPSAPSFIAKEADHVAAASPEREPITPEPAMPKPDPVVSKPEPNPNAIVAVTEAGQDENLPFNKRLGNIGKAASMNNVTVAANLQKPNDSSLSSGLPFVSAPVQSK